MYTMRLLRCTKILKNIPIRIQVRTLDTEWRFRHLTQYFSTYSGRFLNRLRPKWSRRHVLYQRGSQGSFDIFSNQQHRILATCEKQPPLISRHVPLIVYTFRYLNTQDIHVYIISFPFIKSLNKAYPLRSLLFQITRFCFHRFRIQFSLSAVFFFLSIYF